MKAVGILRHMRRIVRARRSRSLTAISLIALILISNVISGPALAARSGPLGGGRDAPLAGGWPQSVATPPILLVPATVVAPQPEGQVPPPAPVIPPAVKAPRTASGQAQSTIQPGPIQTGPFGVARLAYSSDGTVLALATAFGLYLYDSEMSEPIGHIDTGGAVSCVAFSPNGTLLAAGSLANEVQLWQIGDGQLAHDLQAPSGQVNAVAFSPDGTLLAEASTDNLIRLWNVADGALIRTLSGHTGSVLSVAFAPDGKSLASGGTDGAVRIWSVSNGVSTASAVGAVGGVTRVAYSPDGSFIALGSGDGAVRFWQVKGGSQPLATLTGHKGGITDLSFDIDGTLVASASIDGAVRLWQVPDGKLVTVLPASTGALASMAIQPNEPMLITFSYTGEFRLWDLSTLQSPATCSDNVDFVADVTVPDNSVVPSGVPFEKIWRVRNSGTCTWNANYQVVFASGVQMDGASPQPLITVVPGATLDIAITMIAPPQPGLYQGVWRLVNPVGQPFGVGLGVAIQSGVPSPFPAVNISASATNINAWDYVTIQATALNVVQAWLDGALLVNGFLQKTVQLCGTTTFTVDGLLPDGTHIAQSVTVTVNGSCGGESHLKIKDLEASNEDPEVHQSVHFRARVKNEGSEDADGFDLRWRPSEHSAYSTVGHDLDLDAGDDRWVDWNFTFDDSGTYETKARIDFDDKETDRTLSIHVHQPAGPDVVIESLTADSTTVQAGQTVHFSVVVWNRGGSAASGYRLIWKPSGSSPFLLLSNGVNLGPGETQTYDFDYTFSQAGTYNTQAIINPAGTTMTRALTNSMTLQIQVSSIWPTPTLGAPTPTPTPGLPPSGNPGLVITSLTANPAAPLYTDSVLFTAIVRNEGDGPANGFRLLWRPSPDAPFDVKADNQNLAAGAEMPFTFNYTFGVTGTFETEALVEFVAVRGLALGRGPALLPNSNARTLVVAVGPLGSSLKKVTVPTPTATPSPTLAGVTPTPEMTATNEPSPTATTVELTPVVLPSVQPPPVETSVADEPTPVVPPTDAPPVDTPVVSEPTPEVVPPTDAPPPPTDTPVVDEPTPVILPSVPPMDTPVVSEPTPVVVPPTIAPPPPPADTPVVNEPTPVIMPPAPPPPEVPVVSEPTPVTLPTVAPAPPPPPPPPPPTQPASAEERVTGGNAAPTATPAPRAGMASPRGKPTAWRKAAEGSGQPGPTMASIRTGKRTTQTSGLAAPRVDPPTPRPKPPTMTPEPPPPTPTLHPEGVPSEADGHASDGQ